MTHITDEALVLFFQGGQGTESGQGGKDANCGEGGRKVIHNGYPSGKEKPKQPLTHQQSLCPKAAMQEGETNKASSIARDDLEDMRNQALEEIMHRYRYIVLGRTKIYFLLGGDRDDLIQEGMIGLFKAVMDYDPQQNTLFKTFAYICVERQIQTAVKAANRQKHQPLNDYISLEGAKPSDNHMDIISESMSEFPSPEEVILYEERLEILENHLQVKLSHREKEVLSLFMEDLSYEAIGNTLQIDTKAVDNALQRIRSKFSSLEDK